MKIAFITPNIYSTGGRERVLANWANYFSECLNYKVSIITPFRRNERPFFPFNTNIEIVNISSKKKGNSIIPSIFHFYERFKYRKILNKELTTILGHNNYDIVISLWWGEDYKVLYKIKDKSKKILTYHLTNSAIKQSIYNESNIIRKIKKIYNYHRDLHIAAKYDAFIVLTKTDMNDWLNDYKFTNIDYIPNALELSTDKCSTLKEKVILCLGRLSYEKGVDRIINVWQHIHYLYPDWVLRIVGSGSEEKKLKQLARDYNILNIEFQPFTDNVIQQFCESSIFVLGSRYEGFGMVLIEAQNFGLPVVAYDIKCGPADIIIDGESGFLIPDNSEILFAKKISELIENETLRKRMGEAAKIISQTKFSKSIIYDKWNDLFNRLLKS